MRKWGKRILCDKGAKCMRPVLSAHLGPQLNLDGGLGSRVWVRDSGTVRLAVREESAEFIWGLKMLREKASWKCQVFFVYLQELEITLHLRVPIIQRCSICMYNQGDMFRNRRALSLRENHDFSFAHMFACIFMCIF